MTSAGRFDNLHLLGAGTLGRLYRAHDARHDRLVALRIVDSAIAGDPARRAALFADVATARAFTHPHAAGLLELVVVNFAHEIVCVVHELAEGQPLSAIIAAGALEPRIALRYTLQMAEALAAANEAGIVHGALEPAQVIVGELGEVKILDVGLSGWTAGAKGRGAVLALEADAAAADASATDATEPDAAAAGRRSSLRYASPEQLLGEAVDARVDVFAVGAILYEMLAGRPAFSGNSPSDLALQILRATPDPPSSFNPAVSRAADAIVQRAMAKSLERRYPSAAALAADVGDLLLASSLEQAPDVAATTVDGEVQAGDAAPRVAELVDRTAEAEPPAPVEPPASAGPVAHAEPAARAEVAAHAEPPARTEPAALAAPVTHVEPVGHAEPPSPADAVGPHFFAREEALPPTGGRQAAEASLSAEPPALAARGRQAATTARPMSGRSRVRRAVWWLAGAAALVILLAGAAWFGRNALLPGKDPVAPAPRPKIMVTSFSVAGEGAPVYLGPGFAEDLAARLSEISGVAVVGRTAIRSSESASDWRARAKMMGATFVVRGLVRPGPYAVHVDAELLDAASGQPAWSQHFSREPRQISALQAEIASQLALQLKLAAPTSTRWARASARKNDPEAYDSYLQGREAADRRDRARAIALYDQALQRDPGLVEARAALSQAIYLEEYYAGATRDSSPSGRALREAEAALAEDAELPAAHLAAALAAPTLTTAASSLSRTLAYDPSNGEAWHHVGDIVNELDPAKSIPYYYASLAFEPSIDANWRDLAAAHSAMGNAESARDAIARGEAARPDRPWWRQVRARMEAEQGRYEEALQALGSDPSVESTPIVWLMGRIVPLALAGRVPDARREASRLVERYPAFCEGGAVLSALEIDSGAVDEGRQRAAAILSSASRVGAEPALSVCAALAAAGTGDPAEAAGWMSRLAGDERAVRIWTRQAIFGAALSFRLGWYPWSKVVGSQPMQVAGGQLAQSLQRIRDDVERRLPAPPR